MRSPRPLAIISSFLIVATSIPASMFSQTAPKPPQLKQPAPRQPQPKRPQRADALAPAINELLTLYPLAPESVRKMDSGNAQAASEEETKPPADDAPIQKLFDYWRLQGGTGSKPSDKVRQRLLEACEDRPEGVLFLLDFLPESTDSHDRIYKLLQDEQVASYSKSFLWSWLQINSRYYRDDLISSAHEEAVNGTSNGYNLRLLARVDWETATPLVESLASGGNSQMRSVALSLLYEQALQKGDSAQAERLRALLKAIVINRQAAQDERETALSSLADAEWDGQEDWVVSLLADPALSGLKEDAGASDGGSKAGAEEKSEEDAPNILSLLLGTYQDKWFPVISKLVGHRQRAIHSSAVKLLAEHLGREWTDKNIKKEIAQKLAPWLTDQNWAAADGRSKFIQSLADTQTPELPPGLIWILEHDEDPDNRAAAANALTRYRDQYASPALRRALEKEENEDRRKIFVTALAQFGGFSDDEMAEAIEAYAKMVVTKAGEEEINQAKSGDSEKPLPLMVSIGRILSESRSDSESETVEVAETLAIKLIERAKSLRQSQPAVARQILRAIEGASLRVAETNLVERIGAGWADLDAIKLALENSASLRKNAVDELYSMIKQGGYAAGIGAAILSDERENRETLAGTDSKAQFALLAGARYLRDKLPVELAGKLLEAPNRALAKAAESYLQVEDSAEARKLILARRRGEAYILGHGASIDHSKSSDWEELMRKEIKSRNDLEAIYAIALAGWSEISGVVIRVRGGKAEISLYENEGRRDVRALTESEFEELKSFTSRQEVEDLGPENYLCPEHQGCYEYLRLTKDGGRRIMLYALRRAPRNPTLHEELSGLFYRLSQSGDYVSRYEIEDRIPGVEVLLADKKQEAMMVCGEGPEIRVLIGEKGVEYKQKIAEAMPVWREFSSGKPGKMTAEPATCRMSGMIASLMKVRWNSPVRGIRSPIRSGDAWIYVPFASDSGVWKLEYGAEPAKIISGSYNNPVTTPDGKWLVAVKIVKDGGEYSYQLVRHNLQTGNEYPVTLPNGVRRNPIAYVTAHAKVLLGHAENDGEPDASVVNYLLDPDTGTVQQVKGEFGPLREGFIRELQPTGNPNEFWAALPDFKMEATQIGRYDSLNFIFTPIAKLPGLILRSNEFWVDAAGDKIWVTYQGQLLTIPLPPKSK